MARCAGPKSRCAALLRTGNFSYRFVDRSLVVRVAPASSRLRRTPSSDFDSSSFSEAEEMSSRCPTVTANTPSSVARLTRPAYPPSENWAPSFAATVRTTSRSPRRRMTSVTEVVERRSLRNRRQMRLALLAGYIDEGGLIEQPRVGQNRPGDLDLVLPRQLLHQRRRRVIDPRQARSKRSHGYRFPWLGTKPTRISSNNSTCWLSKRAAPSRNSSDIRSMASALLFAVPFLTMSSSSGIREAAAMKNSVA